MSVKTKQNSCLWYPIPPSTDERTRRFGGKRANGSTYLCFSSRSNAFHLQKNAYSKRFLEMIDRLGYQNIQTHFVDFDKEREVAERLRIKEYGKWVIQFGSRRMELAEHQFYRSAKDDVEFVGDVQPCQKFSDFTSKATV